MTLRHGGGPLKPVGPGADLAFGRGNGGVMQETAQAGRHGPTAWWRIPSRDASEARARWVVAMTVLATAFVSAPPLVATSEAPVLMAGITAGVVGCFGLVYHRARVPLVVDVLLALAFFVLLGLAEIPMHAFGLGFQGILLLSLLSSTRATVVRAIVYPLVFLAGTFFWAERQAVVDQLVLHAALFGGPINLLCVSFLGAQLALSLRALDANSRRQRLISETGSQLIGITDATRITRVGWQALHALAAETPGLRVVPVERVRPEDQPGRLITYAAGPYPNLLVSSAVDLDSPQLEQALTDPLEDGSRWVVLSRAEMPTFVVGVGHSREPARAVLDAAESLINQVVLAYRNSLAHTDLLQQARTDALTGLANRQGFTEVTAQLLARPEPVPLTMMFVDLDNFKAVNDNLGHAAGDELLIRVGELLRSVVRGADVVARLGGDEFALLLNGVDAQTGQRVADRIVLGVSTFAGDPEGRYRIGASIGMAHAQPGSDLADLLIRADVAMYRAKTAGKGRVQLWQPGLTVPG
ncbi:GGDEF domain-containing protein [Kineosporia babensis]|uniref:GGDEF domain-containing protein n=1 Tax=Kineosporia babensis TaxID=499548 RepID=A0A9X1SX61_9ACTN|nr:GGDEF domain-containing protein [Kineosporia babensis]MCD5314830.1 GGDEF domain-containing protein [Kineosporia babensis]